MIATPRPHPRFIIAMAVVVASLAGAEPSSKTPSLYPAQSPGLQRPSGKIVRGPQGVYHPPFNPGRLDPQTTVDLRATILWANEGSPYPDDKPLSSLPATLPERSKNNAELYPLNAVPVGDAFWFVGGTVIGRQHRDLPWAYIKTLFDGDGLRFEATRNAHVTVHGIRVENVEDGIAPRLAANTPLDGVSWKIDQCYFKYIRDDVVENDALLSGEISDCLVDGTFVFISQRPGARSTTTRPEAVTRVRDCIVHLQRMPYGKDIGGDVPAAGSIVDGRGPGMPFKFKGAPSGRLEVRDSIFLVEGMSVNGPNSMNFPDWEGCAYENVTVVWRGGGKYPGRLPARGVTVTDDLSVFTRAREAWIAAHPGATTGL